MHARPQVCLLAYAIPTTATLPRDVEPRVRCEVIAAIGEWAAACPATFLCDAYLKYLAWAQVRKWFWGGMAQRLHAWCS